MNEKIEGIERAARDLIRQAFEKGVRQGRQEERARQEHLGNCDLLMDVDEDAPMYDAVAVLVGYCPYRVIDLPRGCVYGGDVDDEDITLAKIREYVRTELKLDEPITVINDHALEGKIFECGNYGDDKWCVHGVTKGYA